MTINDLYTQINQLSKSVEYAFRNNANQNTFKYEGRHGKDLRFLRIQSKGESQVTVTERNLKKIASKVRPYVPFQIDVIVGASGNWRSLFESALAYTPLFYMCKVKAQRHLIWAPEHPHQIGVLTEVNDDLLKVFNKHSRIIDFRFYMEQCYPFEHCYNDFKNGLSELLPLVKTQDESINSVYDIYDIEQMNDLIQNLEKNSYSDFHKELFSNHQFALCDVARAYLMFLKAKDYFAFY